MTTPQHDDPFGEATGKVLQALAVLTTVGESAVTFAAGTQRQSRQDVWRVVASSAIDLAGPGPASADLIEP